MTVYMKHGPCKQPIATFVGKELPKAGYMIKSRDFVLMNGKRPRPFGPIVCQHCKCITSTDDLYLEDEHGIQHLSSYSGELGRNG